MTTIVALGNGNLDDEFMVGEEVLGTTIKFTQYSSLMGIKPGETLTLRDSCLRAHARFRKTNAGEAIAKHVAGSVDGFVS